MKQRNEEADEASEDTLRLSIDAKATVKVGPFARGGKSRVRTSVADHDFEATATLTPVGLLLPASDELFLYAVTSKVTSDCLVDRLVDWWETVKGRFPLVRILVINLDNGPESHSRRTQFMHRLLVFAQRFHLTIRLAYYPPYHSKYNPIERCWGIFWSSTGMVPCCIFGRGGGPVCQHHDLERNTSRGLTGDHHVSDRGQAHQRSHAGCRNPR